MTAGAERRLMPSKLPKGVSEKRLATANPDHFSAFSVSHPGHCWTPARGNPHRYLGALD